MIDIDRFFEILTNVCNELPDDFFRELHHGVSLDEGMKISPYARENDLIIMGEYQRTRIGNRIVRNLAAQCHDASPALFEQPAEEYGHRAVEL